MGLHKLWLCPACTFPFPGPPVLGHTHQSLPLCQLEPPRPVLSTCAVYTLSTQTHTHTHSSKPHMLVTWAIQDCLLPLDASHSPGYFTSASDRLLPMNQDTHNLHHPWVWYVYSSGMQDSRTHFVIFAALLQRIQMKGQTGYIQYEKGCMESTPSVGTLSVGRPISLALCRLSKGCHPFGFLWGLLWEDKVANWLHGELSKTCLLRFFLAYLWHTHSSRIGDRATGDEQGQGQMSYFLQGYPSLWQKQGVGHVSGSMACLQEGVMNQAWQIKLWRKQIGGLVCVCVCARTCACMRVKTLWHCVKSLRETVVYEERFIWVHEFTDFGSWLTGSLAGGLRQGRISWCSCDRLKLLVSWQPGNREE
jgi:hypothetical protein